MMWCKKFWRNPLALQQMTLSGNVTMNKSTTTRAPLEKCRLASKMFSIRVQSFLRPYSHSCVRDVVDNSKRDSWKYVFFVYQQFASLKVYWSVMLCIFSLPFHFPSPVSSFCHMFRQPELHFSVTMLSLVTCNTWNMEEINRDAERKYDYNTIVVLLPHICGGARKYLIGYRRRHTHTQTNTLEYKWA